MSSFNPYLSPSNQYHWTGEAGRFRDDNDAMDIESSTSSSSSSENLHTQGSTTPEPYPLPYPHAHPYLYSHSNPVPDPKTFGISGSIEDVATILTCGNCSHDIIISGRLLSEGILLVPASPVPHLLRTNGVPSLDEEPNIHDYIHTTASAIARLDWEIARINAILQTLGTERNKLFRSVEEHKMLLSPMRKLPEDLLGKILLKCEKGSACDVFPEVPDSFDPASGPLLVTQVCRKWRQKALRMPELWTMLRIRIGRGELQETRRLPLIQAWLERSANQPLTICMVEHLLRSPVYNSDSSNPAVGMLMAVAERWDRFYLATHSLTIHWPLFLGLHRVIRNLRHCSVITHPGDNAPPHTLANLVPHEAFVHLLSNASALKSYTLDSNISIAALVYPKSTITHLNLYTLQKKRAIPLSLVFDTLKQCPALASLRVHCHSAVDVIATAHLSHSALRELDVSIENTTGPGVENLLRHCTLPQLCSLGISMPKLEWDQRTFMEFLERCGPLNSLSICCENLAQQPLLQILRRSTELTSLTINLGLNITDNLLLELIPAPVPEKSDVEPTVLLTRLKRLELGGRLFIQADTFLSLITSRRYPHARIGNVAQLEEVFIHCEGLVFGFVNSYVVERLDELRWWGLRVRIIQGTIVEYPVPL